MSLTTTLTNGRQARAGFTLAGREDQVPEDSASPRTRKETMESVETLNGPLGHSDKPTHLVEATTLPNGDAPTLLDVPPPSIAPFIWATVGAIDWEKLATRALQTRGTGSSVALGKLHYGAFNIVKFLHFDDGVTWVARVPQLRRLESLRSEDEHRYIEDQMSSEVASLRYVKWHSTIPVPAVFYCSFAKDGDGVGLPFTLMSLVPGVPLANLWEDMSDENRSCILRQVVDILFQLSQKCRFPMIGSLHMSTSSLECSREGEPSWVIRKLVARPFDSPGTTFTGGPYRTALEYWTELVTDKLISVRQNAFGAPSNMTHYAGLWLMRTLIPHLYDLNHAALDAAGFALMPADFHSQNIMVEMQPTGEPLITGILDWDWTSTVPSNSFCQFPLFIVDHPDWDPDDPRHERVDAHQDTFLEHLRLMEAETTPSATLASAFDNYRASYLFEQGLNYTYQSVNAELWRHIFGQDRPHFRYDVIDALVDGALRSTRDEFERDTEVYKEIKRVLGARVRGYIDKEALLELVVDHPELVEARRYLESI